MKKLILKTALVTLGVALVLAVSVFGIVSFCAPATMMRFSSSLGLEKISGDYAYQEYQKSQDVSYLAIAFEISAEYKSDAVADERFEELVSHQDFETYCLGQDTAADPLTPVSYRDYVIGNGVCVKYRLARTEEEKAEVYAYALRETATAFSAGNPVLMLAVEAAQAEDAAFCGYLLANLPTAGFEENQDYLYILTVLEEASGNE